MDIRLVPPVGHLTSEYTIELCSDFASNYSKDDSLLETDDINTLIKTGNQILCNDIKPAVFPPSLPLAHFSLVMLAVASVGQVEANFDWTFQPNINNWFFKLSSNNFCMCVLERMQPSKSSELLDSQHFS